MEQRRFFDPNQPQTLQGAVLFSYLNAGISILSFLSAHNFWSRLVALTLIVGGVGAFGIANERRWGYYLAVGVAGVFLVAQVVMFFLFPFVFAAMLNLLFSVFLLAVVLHPTSRSYQRLYFH